MKTQWHTIFVLNQITRQWEKIAEIKSPGLANHIINQVLAPLYGSKNIRTAEGKVNTLPKHFYL